MSYTTPMTSVTKNYTVMAGDTLWGIAQRQYGTGLMWWLIAQNNNINDPRSLTPGQILALP